MNKRLKRVMWIAPLAILGIALFIFIGGSIVMLLWNWLAPLLFGLREISFWQAVGLLALCRVLFGGFGGGGRRSYSGRRFKERLHERIAERWDQMTPEEREKVRQKFYDRSGQTRPLDSTPSAG